MKSKNGYKNSTINNNDILPQFTISVFLQQLHNTQTVLCLYVTKSVRTKKTGSKIKKNLFFIVNIENQFFLSDAISEEMHF